jgi:hypothetical protein
MASKPGPSTIVRLPESNRQQHYAEAFEKTGGGSRPAVPPPPLTLDIGKALVARLAKDFRGGKLQLDVPPIWGRVKKDAGVVEVMSWQPGEMDLAGRFLLGFSLSYEFQSDRGQAYHIRVRIFSDAALRVSRRDNKFKQFIVWFGNRLAQYANADDFRPLLLSHSGDEPRNFTGIDLVSWYELSAHPLVHQDVAHRADKSRDHIVRIGDSIRHSGASPDDVGTLTLFVKWQSQVSALGAAHVLANRGLATIGTSVLWERGGDDPRRPIGPYVHPADLRFADGQVAPLDAAIARIDPNLFVEGNLIRRPGRGKRTIRVSGYRRIEPTENNRRPSIKLVGRGQRLVDAEIIGINAAVPTVARNGDLYFYEDLLELRRPARIQSKSPRKKSILTLGGDSGAGVYAVAKDGAAADFGGLVVCGNGRSGVSGLAYAINADRIFEALKLELEKMP